MEIIKYIPDNSIDAIVTDPPWNMGYFNDDNKDWKDYRKFLRKILQEFERISKYGIIVFQSTKAIIEVARVFKGYECFAIVKNFSQMTGKRLPNCWDIAFYKIHYGYKGNGRNWFLSNTAGMIKEKAKHPTQRGLDIMSYLLSLFNWNLILDPFSGSGTTLMACKKLGINYIGIEINKEYYKESILRVDKQIKNATLKRWIK